MTQVWTSCSYVKQATFSRALMGVVSTSVIGSVRSRWKRRAEMAFEAAQRLLAGLAFGHLAIEVGAGLGIATSAGDGDGVQRAVELAIAAAV